MPKISLLGANLSQEALIKRKIGITFDLAGAASPSYVMLVEKNKNPLLTFGPRLLCHKVKKKLLTLQLRPCNPFHFFVRSAIIF